MSRSENARAGGADGLFGGEHDREPIGFSDLDPDEALLVSLFRSWRYGAPTAAIATHMLAIRLHRINYQEYTNLFLKTFKSIGAVCGGQPERIGHPLLAPEEEALIGRVAALIDRPPAGQPAPHPFSVRPVEAITRSGRDRLELMIARSYCLVHTRLAERP